MDAKRRRSFRWWLLAAPPAVLVVAAVFLYGCQQTAPPTAAGPAPAAAPAGPPLFRDVTAQAGITHTYRNGEESGHFAILESLGGGVALIDYDGDGLLDVFLTGGGHYDNPPDLHDIKGYPCKLYKNLGNWQFQEVTATVGLDKPVFFTHGAAVADYDRDGWPDLLVTGWGRMVLYHNVPDGSGGRRFVEVTDKAGLADDSWSTSAAWADFDGDGYPDLYVDHYVDWSFEHKHPTCTYDGKTRDVCPPKNFEPLPHKLYRNKGDGTFVEVSKEAGLRVPRTDKDYEALTWLSKEAIDRLKAADKAKEYGKGLGVLAVDVNADGKPDVYVCNDTVDNFLYMNRSEPGKIRFEEIGLAAGVARDDRGSPNGSMGADAGDPTGSGRPAIWVTNYESEMHALYHNECKQGKEFFRYTTQVSGIGAIGQTYVGWGTAFVDFDHHGWQDLFIVNGHAIRFPTNKAIKRAQRPVLLRNVGQGKFKAITEQGGDYFTTDHCGRGAAFGDLDNDGLTDVIISNLNEPVAVLKNDAGKGNHWLGVELRTRDNRDLVGARVVLEADGRSQTRFAKGGGSYASANDPRHVFGLGEAKKIDRLTVVWPSGKEQHWEGMEVDRYWRLTEGEKEAR